MDAHEVKQCEHCGVERYTTSSKRRHVRNKHGGVLRRVCAAETEWVSSPQVDPSTEEANEIVDVDVPGDLDQILKNFLSRKILS